MFFHSLPSLIIFLPFIFITYPLIKYFSKKYSNIYLLIFSLFFYGFDTPWFLIPLLISCICDYFISKELIENKENSKKKRRVLLSTSILINIGLLFIFKYSFEISEGLNLFNNSTFLDDLKKIILPVGISFYTFQTLSFSIDSFKGEIFRMPYFTDYLLYVSYFPQLVAGPILRPTDFFNINASPLLDQKKSNYKDGFTRICFGLFLKLCIADELAIFNDIAFDADFYNLGLIDAWTMAFGFGLQIYFDFSAYSHMAIGISNIIGLPIKENFMFPYSSLSVTEFWRRWHISLSQWVSDYLYKSLNKKLPSYFYGLIPLLLTWTIMGIWHGASLRFAFWGLLNGCFVIIHRIFKVSDFKFLKLNNFKLISHFLTLFSIMSTWLFFRSNSWEQSNYLFKTLFNLNKLDIDFSENYYLIVFLFTVTNLFLGILWNSKYAILFKENEIIKLFITSIALSFSMIFINRQTSFIYFQF